MAYMGKYYHMKEYELGDAPEYSADQWKNEKFNLGLDFPNLPYLIDGEVKLTESLAIHRYLANKHQPELLGASPQQRAEVSMLEGLICGSGLKNLVTGPCYANKKEEALQAIKDKLPQIANYIGINSFLTGSTPVYIDFYFFELLELMAYITDGAIFTDHPNLVQYHYNVATLDGLK